MLTPHPDRALYRQVGFPRVYKFAELRRIARAIGRCADRRTALHCIAGAANDLARAQQKAEGPPPPSERPAAVKGHLSSLADALEEAARLETTLTVEHYLRIAEGANPRGLKIDPCYLKAYAAAVRAASAGVAVRTGPRTNDALNRFLWKLAGHVEAFASWRPTVSKNDFYTPATPYGGRFFELATACLDPLDIKPSNQALGGAIERALAGVSTN